MDCETIRWDMIPLDYYLYRFLSGHGYRNIVFFNHIEGFYNQYDSEVLLRFIQSSGGNQPDSKKQYFAASIAQAGDMIRAVLQDQTTPTAVVMMLASRYVLSPDNVSENERDFYTKLMISSEKCNQNI